MSDPASPPRAARPMTAADYCEGKPLVAGASEHPTRDLVVGALVGAAALWLVPRVLDAVADRYGFGGGDLPDDYDTEGLELEE